MKPEFYINGHGKQEIIEVNHFLIQTVRIPTTEKPSLKKIMQIALNMGQFQGKNGTSNYITKKECEIKLEDILDSKHINNILKILNKN